MHEKTRMNHPIFGLSSWLNQRPAQGPGPGSRSVCRAPKPESPGRLGDVLLHYPVVDFFHPLHAGMHGRLAAVLLLLVLMPHGQVPCHGSWFESLSSTLSYGVFL